MSPAKVLLAAIGVFLILFALRYCQDTWGDLRGDR